MFVHNSLVMQSKLLVHLALYMDIDLLVYGYR